MAKLARPAWLIPLCIVLGILFDLLLWDQQWGLSFTLFIAAVLAAGLWLGAQLKLRPARRSWLLGGAALAFAAVSAISMEPATLVFTRLFAVLFLMLFASDFLAGDWLQYRFSDFAFKLVALIPTGWMAASEMKVKTRKAAQARPAWAVLRGVLLALPIVVVLGALLASADSYFATWLQGIFDFIRLERLPEYVARLVLMAVVALAAYGAYVYAFVRSGQGAAKKPLVQPFIGFTEAAIVLGSVTVLLAAFVVFQFQHFFGGAANVLGPQASSTYAEYARRGFTELWVVALIVLALFALFSSVVRRKGGQQQAFAIMGAVLLALLAVVLVSAFQRLQLYEQAYGFTSMRLLPHIFMIWLGILLLVLVVLEFTGRQRVFAAAVLLAAAGFVATLPLLNLDAFIVRANIAHGLQTRYESQRDMVVDRAYLAQLSPDAVPALVEGYIAQAAAGNQALAQDLAIALACNAYQHDDYVQTWRGWTLSGRNAGFAWQRLQAQPDFPAIEVEPGNYGVWVVQLNGEEHYCH